MKALTKIIQSKNTLEFRLDMLITMQMITLAMMLFLLVQQQS